MLFVHVAGDIGGSMGLLIGASIITLFEALDAFAITLTKRRLGQNGGQKKTPKMAENNI